MAVTPDLNQIAVVMTQLQHNYSQLAQNWFNVFYNPNPMDVNVSFFDELGNLITYTVPNRAKDFRNILNGEGSPEGLVVGMMGYIYQDITNGEAYIKKTASGNTGWVKFANKEEVDSIVTKGTGSPEGSVVGTVGSLYIDTYIPEGETTGGKMYLKTTPTGNTGWIEAFSSDTATKDFVNTAIEATVGDLDDLTTENKTTVVSAINEINGKDFLPSQIGQNGKFLYTNGETASWSKGSIFSPPIFSFQWVDHLLTDQSWLRADTFSWQDGNVYSVGYNHLVNDIDGKTLQSETIDGITVQFYMADDGHKIAPVSQSTHIYSLFAINGHDPYYIIDTENERFKLPFQIHGEIVDKYTGADGWYRIYSDGWCEQGSSYTLVPTSGVNITLLKSYSSMDYSVFVDRCTANFTSGQSNPVAGRVSGSQIWLSVGGGADEYAQWYTCGYLETGEYPTTNSINKYLYFYIGQFDQTATEQTAGITSAQLNAKVDKSDMVEVIAVTEQVDNGTSGYRVWSNGYCEQWGLITGATESTDNQTINFIKTFKDTNYIFFTTPISSTTIDVANLIEKSGERTTSSTKTLYTCNRSWKASGYLTIES